MYFGRLFLRQIAEFFLVLFLLVLVTFFLMKVAPGGPFDEEQTLPAEIKLQLIKQYHLDQNFFQQSLHYIVNFLQGDWGVSIKYGSRPVLDIILETLPVSLELGFYGLLIPLGLGLPLGILAAIYWGTWIDSLAMFFAILGMTLPNFLLASLLILVLAQYLGIFPVALWEGWAYKVLPALTIGLRPAALVARLIRASLLEILPQDFLRTASSKGLSHRQVVFKHALANAILPLLVFMGPLATNILTGSFIAEHIFAVPGLAKYFISAIGNRDYPLIMGLTLVYAFILLFCNGLMDLLARWIDPRLQSKSQE